MVIYILSLFCGLIVLFKCSCFVYIRRLLFNTEVYADECAPTFIHTGRRAHTHWRKRMCLGLLFCSILELDLEHGDELHQNWHNIVKCVKSLFVFVSRSLTFSLSLPSRIQKHSQRRFGNPLACRPRWGLISACLHSSQSSLSLSLSLATYSQTYRKTHIHTARPTLLEQLCDRRG